jgi:uncharacterized oxidoreductase
MQTTGNTILITGATSGIGRAFAAEFLRLGNRVIACGRREDRLRELQAEHPGIITRVCDIQDEDQRVALAEWAVREHPELNMLINNAGIQLVSDFTGPVKVSRLHSELETNLVAPAHLASLLVPHLSAQAGAAILNITSGLAFVPLAPVAMYCATKAALHSLTLSLRYQLRETGIQVIEIAPPAVDTELGPETRENSQSSHGGIPVEEFLSEAMEGLAQGELEIAVAGAHYLRAHPETAFGRLNP